MAVRIAVPLSLSQNNGAFPQFSPSDNPSAACNHFLTRLLTFNYLLTCNVQMLFIPTSFSFDWSMDAIPLVTSFTDLRNLATLLLYIAMCLALRFLFFSYNHSAASTSANGGLVGAKNNGRSRHGSASSEDSFEECLEFAKTIKATSHSGKTRLWKLKRGLCEVRAGEEEEVKMTSSSDLFVFGCLVITLALLPVTNLFFYVGFVLAERLLYLPSVGSCLLLTEGVGIATQKLADQCWKYLPRKLLK